MRQDFAKMKLEKLKTAKSFTRNHRQVDVSRGKYKLPFKILADQGGAGDPEAVKGFKNIILRCLKMGYPFVKRHWQSRRLMFLEFEEEVNSEFERCWSIWEEEWGNKELLGGVPAVVNSGPSSAQLLAPNLPAKAIEMGTGASDSKLTADESEGENNSMDGESLDDDDDDEEDEEGKAPPKSKAKAKAQASSTKAKAKPKPKTPKAKAKPKAKGKNTSSSKDVTPVKPEKLAKETSTLYSVTMTSAESLLGEIKKSSVWAFSKKFGPSFAARLEKAIDKCKHARSDFHAEFMSRDFKHMKDSYEENGLNVNMNTFQDLIPFLDKVNAEKQRLLGFLDSHKATQDSEDED